MKILRQNKPFFFVFCISILFYLRHLIFVNTFSVNIFFWDQWDYLTEMFEGKSLIEQFLRIHGPHRMGVGIWISNLLYQTFRWDARVDAYLICTLYLISTLIALELKYNITKKIGYTDFIIPMLFFSFTYYESVITTPNPSLNAIPILLLLCIARVILWDDLIRKMLSISFLSFWAMFTGFGIFVGFYSPLLITFVFLLERHGKTLALKESLAFGVSILVSLFTIFSFFYEYKLQPASDCFQFPHPRPFEYITFVLIGLGNFFNLHGKFLGIFTLGILGFLVAFILGAFKSFFETLDQTRRQQSTVISLTFLISYSFLFLLFSAIGRVCIGPEIGARASRYTAYQIPFFFSLWVYFNISKIKILKDLYFYFLLLFSVLGNFFFFQYEWDNIRYYSFKKHTWMETYLETKSIETANEKSGGGVYPVPTATNLQEKLNFLERNHLGPFKNQKKTNF